MRDELLHAQCDAHPYPLLFATVSGAHLYGFPSPDSDYDLRGVHLLPVQDVVGLMEPKETLDTASVVDGVEMDLVTHDAKKFFLLMLKRNGYVLEQLFSPLVVRTSPDHEELKAIGTRCITRHHVHHYLGFATSERKLLLKEPALKIKPLLYVYRVYLTGIHLMSSGRIEANLETLAAEYKLSFLHDLIAAKRSGAEKGAAIGIDLEFHLNQFDSLEAQLKAAGERTHLPYETNARSSLNDLLLRLRLRNA